MGRKQYTDEPIAFALRQAELGTPLAESIRSPEVSEQMLTRKTKEPPLPWLSNGGPELQGLEGVAGRAVLASADATTNPIPHLRRTAGDSGP